MLTKLQGVVLHSFKYGDSGRIAKIYTKEKGLLSFFLRSTYSKKKGSNTALYQPLTILDLDADIRGNNSLHRIKEASLAIQVEPRRFDPYRSAISLFMAEVFLHSVQEEESNDELFAFLIHWIEKLYSDQELALMPLLFLMDLTEPLGFYPELETREGYFDLREGLVQPSPPPHADFLSKEITKALTTLRGTDIVARFDVKMPRKERRELLHALLQYFRIHIHYFKPINSHTVLEETFGR